MINYLIRIILLKSIHTRNFNTLAPQMFKVKNGMSPPLLEESFQIAKPNYNLRNKGEFKSHNVKIGLFWYNFLAFIYPKIWDKLPIYWKSLNSLDEFKQNVKNWVQQLDCLCRLCVIYMTLVSFSKSIGKDINFFKILTS